MPRCRLPRGGPRSRLPPLRFLSPPAFSRSWVATCTGRYQLPATCLLSVSHALKAFFHPRPASLVSCWSRPWGFSLQGRSPLAEPYILSDAVALLGFTSWLSSRLDLHGCVGYRGPLASMPASPRQCLFQSAPLQGLAPCECPLLRANCLSQLGSATLLGFLLRGDFSCSAGDLPEVHPLASFGVGALGFADSCSSEYSTSSTVSSTLSSLLPPARFYHLVDHPCSSQSRQPWVTPRKPPVVTNLPRFLFGLPDLLP